ncbi:MICAL-like protein 2 [Lepeophtheirus salmonis]|uniref:MICAL-like protein 2 n=1 Tax=Lepeophtheirus salmonis TaxID=72036 RepID=D3PFK4_LEPSM|nr:MICAL-like protein 2 [Lepeophtheirus salmonis]XP_040580560.1 MICAL-like protein 2 [Lepeophtheirus salmonis]ADD24050.1 MICAL-like protein 2 [Lepeophtheirus salmonis]
MPVQRRGMRALQIWCQRVTSEYSLVDIKDLSHSFRDGLAFCAIIHHFRPELIPEFHVLKPDNIYDNNDLAYRIAEETLGIPSLLDPQDMVDTETPDKFSVVTYVSQFYHLFKDEDGSRSPNVSLTNLSRNSESENDSVLQSSSENNTPQGTPTVAPKRIINQSELIEKYGKDIFNSSSNNKTKLSNSNNSVVARMSHELSLKVKIGNEK